MSKESVILTYDMGGTFIKNGVVNQAGSLKELAQIPTPKPSDTQGREILAAFQQRTQEVAEHYQIAAIGISTHGVVDKGSKTVTCSSYHLPGLKNLPLVKMLEAEFNVPVAIDNDVNSAGIGEMVAGSAKQWKNCIFVALGTSIGGAIILNGQLVHGVGSCGGEIGVMITNDSEKGGDYRSGAWESYASASALMKSYQKAIGAELVTPEDFTQALQSKDAIACKVMDDYVHRLGSGLVGLAHTLAPEAFIIGGAITSLEGLLLDPLKENFYRRVLEPCRQIQMVTATLGNKAGMLGAAELARQERSL